MRDTDPTSPPAGRKLSDSKKMGNICVPPPTFVQRSIHLASFFFRKIPVAREMNLLGCSGSKQDAALAKSKEEEEAKAAAEAESKKKGPAKKKEMESVKSGFVKTTGA